MANRKKTETIHLRVDPISKVTLECVATLLGTTSTQVILDLIAAKSKLMTTAAMDDRVEVAGFPDGKMVLKEAINIAYDCEDPILAKLRLSFLAYDALSEKDRTITSAIIQHPKYFGGETEIFLNTEQSVKAAEIPTVSLQKIYEQMDTLEEFHTFREKNPYKTTYEGFLKLKKGV